MGDSLLASNTKTLKAMIGPSILNADLANLSAECQNLIQCGIILNNFSHYLKQNKI